MGASSLKKDTLEREELLYSFIFVKRISFIRGDFFLCKVTCKQSMNWRGTHTHLRTRAWYSSHFAPKLSKNPHESTNLISKCTIQRIFMMYFLQVCTFLHGCLKLVHTFLSAYFDKSVYSC